MNDADPYYRVSSEARLPPAAGESVFSGWESDEAIERPPAPCRVIPVTDELRRADEERQQQRSQREQAPARAWAIKAELSVENLRAGNTRLAKRPVQAGREPQRPEALPVIRRAEIQTPVRVKRDKKPTSAVVLCGDGCGRRLRRSRIAIGKCSRCSFKAKTVLVEVEGEAAIQKLPPSIPVLELLDDSTADPATAVPAELEAVSAETVVPAACACGRRLNRRSLARGDGQCGRCRKRGNSAASRRRFYLKQPTTPCTACGEPTRGASGRCQRHAHVGFMTMLRARTAIDHGLNQLWAKLSEEDKTVILGEYADGGGR